MIDREDMLELTRRMTVKRTSMTRIAGAYIDRDGEIDGTFNTSFLKLSAAEKEKNLALAKTIPFAETNRKLKRHRFGEKAREADSMYRLLGGLRSCGLKNDALMEIFYEESGRPVPCREGITRFSCFTTGTMCRRRGRIIRGRENRKMCLNI